MANPQNQVILERAAQRAAGDPFFLGHALARLLDAGRVSRAGLSERLRCPADRLRRLWMCRAPDDTRTSFRQDIERIAAFVGCDAAALAQVLREANALVALGLPGGASPSTLLLAARDRQRDEGTKSGEATT